MTPADGDDRSPEDSRPNDVGDSDFGRADLHPTPKRVIPRRTSSVPAVGPSDVDDSVKEVLRTAFGSAEQSMRKEESPVDSSRSWRRAGKQSTSQRSTGKRSTRLDETGPVDVAEEHSVTTGDTETASPTRRRFRDIAREHDSRIKSRNTVEDQGQKHAGRSVKEATPVKITGDGKKRVVITDDEVLGIKRAAPKEDRQRKKTRRRHDGVTRLPNRRWWTRTPDGRWHLRWYSVVGGLLAVVVLLLLLLTSPLLSIRNIVLEGNVYANQSRLDEIVTQLKGDAILTADLHGATRQIEAIPWVRKARISMHLPSRVVVQIDEREPTAFFRAVDGFIRVIDREGRVLDVIEGDPIDYVRIIGTGPNIAPGEFVGQPFLGAVSLLEALPTNLSDRLVSATVSPEGEISLQLTPNLSIIFGQPTDFQVKLVAVVNEIKRQGSRSYTIIDVSTGEPNVR